MRSDDRCSEAASTRRSARRSAVVAVVLALGCVPAALMATELRGYASLATDYVWRGVSQTDGDPAAQLGVDLDLENGWYLGVWGSTIDFDLLPFNRRDLEVAYYAGVGFDVRDRWTLGARAVAFRYPGQEGISEYDYEEYSLTANFDDRVWVEYAYAPDLYNLDGESHNVELYAETEVPGQLVLGGGVGHYDVARAAGGSFNYWELGVTRGIGRMNLDLRYHDTDGYVPIVSSESRSDPRLVLTLRLVF